MIAVLNGNLSWRCKGVYLCPKQVCLFRNQDGLFSAVEVVSVSYLMRMSKSCCVVERLSHAQAAVWTERLLKPSSCFMRAPQCSLDCISCSHTEHGDGHRKIDGTRHVEYDMHDMRVSHPTPGSRTAPLGIRVLVCRCQGHQAVHLFV